MVVFTIPNRQLAQLVNASLCLHGVAFRTTVYADGSTLFEFDSVHKVEKSIANLPEWDWSA